MAWAGSRAATPAVGRTVKRSAARHHTAHQHKCHFCPRSCHPGSNKTPQTHHDPYSTSCKQHLWSHQLHTLPGITSDHHYHTTTVTPWCADCTTSQSSKPFQGIPMQAVVTKESSGIAGMHCRHHSCCSWQPDQGPWHQLQQQQQPLLLALSATSTCLLTNHLR